MTNQTTFNLNFPRAYISGANDKPDIQADFKTVAEDFYVEEQLGFELAGHGEHLYLFIEKCYENTQYVADEIARFAGVKKQDVSYSGMKDRRAQTRQWFSVYLPHGEMPAWQAFERDTIAVLAQQQHSKKLRRGDHRENRFRIRLRNLKGDRAELQQRLKRIAEQGVPNYVGQQRFGHMGKNLQEADTFLQTAKGKQRGFRQRLMVSVARAWLFNQVLSARVEQGNWNVCGDGDALVEYAGIECASGPLWGRGRLPVSGVVAELEQGLVEQWPHWAHFLEHCGLQQERRALVLKPQDFSAAFESDDLLLSFVLPAGGYATAVLRELLQVQIVAQNPQ